MTVAENSPRRSRMSSRLRVALIVSAALVVAAATVTVLVMSKRTTTHTDEFSLEQIREATRTADLNAPAGNDAREYVEKHLAKENSAGRSVGPGQVKVAILTAKDGAGTIYLVWSGYRSPSKLLVANRTGKSFSTTAVGLRTTSPTNSPSAILEPPIQRVAHGGGHTNGGLDLRRSDCVEAWIAYEIGSIHISSCAELWHAENSPEWIYHHFAGGTTLPGSDKPAITDMSVRSRIQLDLREHIHGPSFVASCSNSGSADVLAQPKKADGTPENPTLQVRANPCTGYRDLIKQSDQQIGASVQFGAADTAVITSTGTYRTLRSNIAPTWEDYVWAQTICQQPNPAACGEERIDERQYLRRLW